MITFKQFLSEQSFNDDDFYLVDTKTKKVVKNIGGPSMHPDTQKHYVKEPHHAVLKGMRAKIQGYTFKSVSESATGAHGEYVGDIAEKTMVNAIINQLFGGQKTEENYDRVYSFIESDTFEAAYEKYYDAFKEKSEASYEHKRTGKAKELSPKTSELLGQFKKELGDLWKKYKDSK